MAKVANAEELSRRGGSKSRTRAQHELEIKLIIQSIRKVLSRIEDAVPFINLAITTSGANLTTNLPATVSPSRLLQASTFLTAGDTQYSIQPGQAVQIGPTFTLSMYMLFAGHAHRWQDPNENVRETTWKEVIHKARVKLRRTTLEGADEIPRGSQTQEQEFFLRNGSASAERHQSPSGSGDEAPFGVPYIAGEGKADEFAYNLLIIEDFDDDRVHSFEEDEPQPGSYDEVELAGIREVIPIHQVSKIFYADTGKILNIGNEGEVNSPILLLKRDINALPPRRMMERLHGNSTWPEEDSRVYSQEPGHGNEADESDIQAQLSRESRASSVEVPADEPPEPPDPWRLPLDLDPEWIAFEVYTERGESDDEDDVPLSEQEEPERRPSARRSREPSLDPQLTNGLASLHLNPAVPSVPSPGGGPASNASSQQLIRHPTASHSASGIFSRGGPIRTSLSLLEMLIRLTALQQFQQASHLSIPDELLNFFLSESSTTGAGGDGEERRRKRWEARRKVGFDPYDESPVKRRGEDGVAERQQAEDGHDELEGWSEDYGYESGSWQSPRPPSRQYRASESPSPMLVRSLRETVDRRTSSPGLRSSPLRQSMSGRQSMPDRRHTTPPTTMAATNTTTPTVTPTGNTAATTTPADHSKTRSAVLREDLGAAVSHQKRGSPLRRDAAAEEDL